MQPTPTPTPEISGELWQPPPQPSRLYRIKADILEYYYHIFKFHYFIERRENNPLEPGKQSEWLRLNPETRIVEWVVNPRAALPIGFIFGALIVLILRRKDKKKKYSFALITVQDVAFVHHVTTGEKLCPAQ